MIFNRLDEQHMPEFVGGKLMVRHSRHAQWGIAPLRALRLGVRVLGLSIGKTAHSIGGGLLVLVVTHDCKSLIGGAKRASSFVR